MTQRELRLKALTNDLANLIYNMGEGASVKHRHAERLAQRITEMLRDPKYQLVLDDLKEGRR